MSYILEFIYSFIDIVYEASLYLLLGFFIAGIISAFFPKDRVENLLGRPGWWTVFKASLFGIPLPLCSCGVIPTALALKRHGADRSGVMSFLVSTPETGVDSILLSYALLGPLMAIVRPIAAFITAMLVGIGSMFFKEPKNEVKDDPFAAAFSGSCCEHGKKESEPAGCCESETKHEIASCCESTHKSSDCCESEKKDCCDSGHEHKEESKLMTAMHYGFGTLLRDIFGSLLLGLVLAAIITAIIPDGFFRQSFGGSWGGYFMSYFLMILVGIPLYMCSSSTTPVAAGMMLAGISPGAALVFLKVGPVTNIASLTVMRKEFGTPIVVFYVIAISIISMLLGFALDILVVTLGWDVYIHNALQNGMNHHSHLTKNLKIGASILMMALIVCHYIDAYRTPKKAS